MSIFMPEFQNTPFFSTKLCWYTDSLDNSFVVSLIAHHIKRFSPAINNILQIDHVSHYAENSVFVCTGGSGHGAKFLPILGEVGISPSNQPNYY